MAEGKRMIDANALSDAICGIGKDMKKPRAVELACLALIAEAPTVDAVEVIRCKDCRESEMHTDFSRKKYLGCTLDPDVIYEVDPDHFCAYGEKR